MKKILIVAMALLSMFSMKIAAQSVGTGASETPDIKHMIYIITLLEKVEGSVFLTPGEPRFLSDIFTRTDEVLPEMSGKQIEDMDWYCYDTEIATIDNKTSEINGLKFGETLIRGTRKDKENNILKEHYFLAFVCPTISIVTPEGAIYRHQKVYGENLHLTFSESLDYVLNTVQLYKGDNPIPEDITDKVAADKNDKNPANGTDGYYESDYGVTENLKVVLAMESRPTGFDGVVGTSGLRLYVDGKTVKFVQTDGNANIATRNVEVFSIETDDKKVNKKIYDGNPQAGTKGSEASITFNDTNAGVFFIKVADYDPVYKIVME